MSDLVDIAGRIYTLELTDGRQMIDDLAWLRDGERVSLRDVVGALERYEPMRAMMAKAVAGYSCDPRVSVTVARAELQRVLASHIVLNRGLREAVVASSMAASQIALNCGREKRDRNGMVSGETSWLARRVGLMREGGKTTTTPWIHTDVLARIAREGLGVEPRTVEVDVEQDVEIEEHWCHSCLERVTTGPDGVCPWCDTACVESPLLVAA